MGSALGVNFIRINMNILYIIQAQNEYSDIYLDLGFFGSLKEARERVKRLDECWRNAKIIRREQITKEFEESLD